MNYCTTIISVFIVGFWIGHLKARIPDDNPKMSKVHNYRTKRVFGPHKVKPHSKPWSVFLFKENGGICGGFLLDIRSLNLSRPIERIPPPGSSDVVVTTAHCVSKLNVSVYYVNSPYAIVADFGVHNPYNDSGESRVRRSSIKVVMHDDYKRNHLIYNDIALIRLDKPVESSDHIQSLPITSHSTAEAVNCLISGWGPYPNKKRGIDGAGVLTMASIKYIDDIIDTRHTLAATSNESEIMPGDSGSAIVCYENEELFAHGVQSSTYEYLETNNITFANLNMLSPWLKSAIRDLYDVTFFHPTLHPYLVGGMDSVMADIEMQYRFLAFMNFIPPEFSIQLEAEHMEYNTLWSEYDIAEWILVKNDSFNWKNLSGYTSEKDVYHCAIACFVQKSEGSCSYLTAMKRCYYSTTRQLCDDASSCIRFGYRESVHIYFDKSSVDSRTDNKPLLVKQTAAGNVEENIHPFDCQCNPRVYVSFEQRKFHVCPAVLYSASGQAFDKASISHDCIDLLIKPYWRNLQEVQDSLRINVKINQTIIKQTPVTFNYNSGMKYPNGIQTLILDLEATVPFHKISEKLIGKGNDWISTPHVLYKNGFMGGRQTEPFSKPWMVLLQNESGPACQGVFINNNFMGENMTKMGFILTTNECANMLSVGISVARFGVHLSTMKSLNEQRAIVHFIGKPPQNHRIGNETHNDIALLGIDPIQINEAVSPMSLNETLGSQSRSTTHAYGWNMKCPHAGMLHEIRMLKSMNNTASYIYGRPLYGYDGACNQKHHTGRPLVQCGSQNGKCILLGLSTQIEKVSNGNVNEHFLNVTSYLPFVRSMMTTLEDMVLKILNIQRVKF